MIETRTRWQHWKPPALAQKDIGRVRYLVLSDIHANWESLQAVLAHADGMYDQALCCGDLIDYGADPNAVTDWLSANVGLVVRGNHDKACVGLADLDRFNSIARAAALWTQRELTPENARYVRSLLQGPLLVDGVSGRAWIAGQRRRILA